MAKKEDIHFTDTMIAVSSLEEVMGFWTITMGFDYVEGGIGWMALQDKKTKQRIVLTGDDFGCPWALAFATKNLEEALTILEARGLKIVQKNTSPGGFRFVFCHDERGIPVVVYVR